MDVLKGWTPGRCGHSTVSQISPTHCSPLRNVRNYNVSLTKDLYVLLCGKRRVLGGYLKVVSQFQFQKDHQIRDGGEIEVEWDTKEDE